MKHGERSENHRTNATLRDTPVVVTNVVTGEAVPSAPEKRPVVGAKPVALVKTLFPEPTPRCSAVNRHGAPCGSFTTVASDHTHCWFHSPEELVSRDEKLAATARGGAVVARTLRRPDAANPALKTLDSIQRFLEELGGEVLRGALSSRDANALVRIAEAAVRAHDSNIGQRLDELEKLAASRARSIGVVP
jgi:hypothetical protein